MRHFSISRFCPQLFALLVLAASLAGSCVTAFAGEVGLAWDATTAPEVLGYKIYYGLVSDVRVIDVGNVTTYRVKDLAPDTYWFCVAAYDFSFNESPCSNVVSITLPPPMYGLREESASAGEVGLAWDATTAPEVLGYKIYYGLVNEVRVIDVGNVTTYRVKGLDPDTYWFCVTAYDAFNEFPCSNVVSITLPPPMYGLREESVSSQPGDAFPAEPYSRNVSENRRSSRPAEEDLLASSFHSVACRLHEPNDSRDPESLCQHSPTFRF